MMGWRNEQCRKVCRIIDDSLANRPTERDSLIVAVQKAFDTLEKQQWIPVTERLPEKSGYYLATVDIGLKVVDVIFFNNGSGFLMANTVTAWKPRPELYHRSGVNMKGEKYD